MHVLHNAFGEQKVKNPTPLDLALALAKAKAFLANLNSSRVHVHVGSRICGGHDTHCEGGNARRLLSVSSSRS